VVLRREGYIEGLQGAGKINTCKIWTVVSIPGRLVLQSSITTIATNLCTFRSRRSSDSLETWLSGGIVGSAILVTNGPMALNDSSAVVTINWKTE
jgi:hypothetical protein